MSFLIVANWKMNGNATLMRAVVDVLCSSPIRDALHREACKVILCPPFTGMATFHSPNPSVLLGAQDCFSVDVEGKGCTGEISAEMLKECGCSHVIIGHSDRRRVFAESSHNVRLKAESALNAGLVPIICIGETLQERERGVSRDILSRQYEGSVPKGGKFMIAYEPIWAIGGSAIPALDMIRESIGVIKSFGDGCCPILYGGSVNEDNICTLRSGVSDIVGVLVGSASIKVEKFSGMIRSLLGCL